MQPLPEKSPCKAPRLRRWTPVLLLLAVVAIVIGAMRGEAAIVLRNAANLCLACIGID